MEHQSSADQDVGFSLDALTRFYSDCDARAAQALEFTGGDANAVDVPNLAASLVPEFDDEARGIGHLLVGHPVSAEEGRRIIYDHAAAYIVKTVGRSDR